MALQITDKQSAFASRFSSGLLFETMWHCDMDCKMRFITCQWSLAVCSLGLLMRGSRQSSALARSSAWRWTPMDHNSGAGQETRNCRVGGFSLSLWGRLAAGGPNLPVKIFLCTVSRLSMLERVKALARFNYLPSTPQPPHPERLATFGLDSVFILLLFNTACHR